MNFGAFGNFMYGVFGIFVWALIGAVVGFFGIFCPAHLNRGATSAGLI